MWPRHNRISHRTISRAAPPLLSLSLYPLLVQSVRGYLLRLCVGGLPIVVSESVHSETHSHFGLSLAESNTAPGIRKHNSAVRVAKSVQSPDDREYSRCISQSHKSGLGVIRPARRHSRTFSTVVTGSGGRGRGGNNNNL